MTNSTTSESVTFGLRNGRPDRDPKTASPPARSQATRLNTPTPPAPRAAVVAGDIGLGSSLKHNNDDNQASSRHPRTRPRNFLYPERCVSYALNEHTVTGRKE